MHVCMLVVPLHRPVAKNVVLIKAGRVEETLTAPPDGSHRITPLQMLAGVWRVFILGRKLRLRM